MKSTVSSKGQVTLPAEVREKLGMSAGTAVHFELQEGGVVVRKGLPGSHPVDQLFGTLRMGRSTEALLDELRGPHPKDETPARTRKPAPSAGPARSAKRGRR